MRPFAFTCLFAMSLGFIVACNNRPAHAAPDGDAKNLPQPASDLPAPDAAEQTRTAVFAGGCFWCVEAVLEPLAGVRDVVSGYAGGTADSADYKKVASGQTDHAEVVQVTYDPKQISYATLLRVFMTMHNPTQPDGQHPDYGRQYRTAIFYATDAERAVAAAYIRQLDDAKIFDKPIATSLEKLDKFYPAEKYHQDYVKVNPDDPYVVRWALPKIEKLKKTFPELIQVKTSS
jgi:peptide-methionine (S)-S-oxide reductase